MTMKYWKIICIESFVMHIRNVNLFLEKTSFSWMHYYWIHYHIPLARGWIEWVLSFDKSVLVYYSFEGFYGSTSLNNNSFSYNHIYHSEYSIHYCKWLCDFLIIFFILMSTVLVQFSIQFRNLILCWLHGNHILSNHSFSYLFILLNSNSCHHIGHKRPFKLMKRKLYLN